jgi:AhpD family alkylhydroperoxidase
MSSDIKQFNQERARLNELVLSSENLDIKRFFALDSAVYRDGALSTQTKELLGLVASAVLRCNDCILYHVDQCRQAGITSAEFHEAMSVVLVVGGSITIPHVRYAFDMWQKAEEIGSQG